MQNQKTLSRTASVLLIIAGIWLIISPVWISISGNALTSVLITGAVIALSGLIQLFTDESVPSWIAGLAAVWLFISTFFLNVSIGAVWNQVVTAAITFVLAYWDGFEVTQIHQSRTHRVM